MRRRALFAYQLLTGLSDAGTGILLILEPGFTLHLMRLHVAEDALPFLSFIGAFVLSTGVSCLFGAWLAGRHDVSQRLEMVWLLTALTRGLVAAFVLVSILSNTLEFGWLTVAVSDGVLAVIQVIGLRKGWLSDDAV
ncbi:hypothetical protein [Acidicapsa acidisoli]|uniref:hypothetical protein n=1 Tax=Acidicapsa acidisoli TaxID=1615681 RepID=UPI0021DF6D3A|nr:hypothetical protein [Acidicapsa acidisoli]